MTEKNEKEQGGKKARGGAEIETRPRLDREEVAIRMARIFFQVHLDKSVGIKLDGNLWVKQMRLFFWDSRGKEGMDVAS